MGAKENAASKKWRLTHSAQAKAATAAWRLEHPELINATHKAWLAAHPEYDICAVNNAWNVANPEKARAISVASRARRWEKLTTRKKPKRCDVCRRSNVPIHYDHCHKSGLFRGWLCRDCNTALGLTHDSIKVLQSLIDYLTAYKERPRVTGATAKAQKLYAARQAASVAKTKAKKAAKA
jgi:hypothetical protein